MKGAGAMEQALQGVRVVEFTSGLAGPWIGRFMAWCGAEVVKVESRAHPSVVRLYVPPREPERGTQPRLSPWFTDWDAGKLFVALDLTKPEAVDLARRLVAQADIVIENQSTGVMEKLGLGYDALVKSKPDLIHFSTTGYGDSGPNCRYVTWGPNIEAMAGLARISGFPGRDCTMTQYAYPDALSALHGLFAVMCALEHRENTGEGQRINLSQLEATVGAIGPLVMEPLVCGREPRQLGNASLHAAPHGCYRCLGEDRWCAISVCEEAQWPILCDVLGHPEWRQDPRFASLGARLENAALLDAEIEGWTSERDAYAVMHSLQAAGIAAGVVQTAEDQFRRDPQLAARGFFERIPHLAKGEVVATGIPLGLTATPGCSVRAGAAIGEDNHTVFRSWLGLHDEEIAHYHAIGAIEAPTG